MILMPVCLSGITCGNVRVASLAKCPDQIPAIGFEELLQLLTTAHGLIGDFRITPTGVGKSWRCGQSEFGIAVIGDLS